LKNDLRNISNAFQYKFGVATDTNASVSEHYLPVLWTDVYVLASKSFIRDDFETIAIEKFFGNESESMFDYYNIINEDLSRDCCSDKSLILPNVKILFGDYEHIFKASVAHYIPLSWTLKCSYIIFQQSNFTIEWNRTDMLWNVSVTVNFGGAKVIISNMSDLSHMEVAGNELHVCSEVLEKYIQKSQRLNEKKTIFIAMSVVTYVCLCASELCLLLTLVTYLGFPELRTVPGINNMFLCLSLLLAQLVLVLASNISVPSTLCTSVGLITHFLWLWHFSWSFLSSLHMFQVFTAKIPAQSLKGREKNVIVVKLTTLSLISPAAVVFAVIIASYITSNTIGYGRQSCYLDSSYLIGFSMFAPICLVTACNLTFLGLTVVSIHKVNQLLNVASCELDQYKNCLLYVKLSSVTGIYWLVTIVAEALDSDVLWFISLLLNGLQGVAIFISYMCNKRVYGLIFTKTSKTLPSFNSSLPQTLTTSE
ncbi:adhesion G protein-coupled receptor E2, partial [Biomphalaria glabrata]